MSEREVKKKIETMSVEKERERKKSGKVFRDRTLLY